MLFPPPGRIWLHLSTTVQINRTPSRFVDHMSMDDTCLHLLHWFISGRSVHRWSIQDVFGNPVLDLMVHHCEQHQRFVTRVFGPARSLSCLGEYSYFSVSRAFGKEFLVLLVMNTPDERAAAARTGKILFVPIRLSQLFIFAAT